MSDFRRGIYEYIRREARPLEKFGHQPRLYALTLKIGETYNYDDDVVYAAAWLHDVGVFIGHRPEDMEALAGWDNTAYAMEKAPGILVETGFPVSKIPAVVEAIRTHQPTGKPISIEGEILRDADILEQLGAVGIARTLCKIGRDNRFRDFSSARMALQKALTSLPSQLVLAAARALAAPRVAVLGDFLKQLEVEAGADLH